MATPVVAWSELEAPFAKRNELPGVGRFQTHYACYHNRGFVSTEAEFLQAKFKSPAGEMWLTVRLRIYVAPAETVLPIKKDRQFSPAFQVQVEVQSARPVTFEGTVHAFALNEQQKNELIIGLGEEPRLPRSVSDSLLAAAAGTPNATDQPFKGKCAVPVSVAFEPELISSLPEEHIAKKVADVTFSNLEFRIPSNMEPRYFLFAIAVGTAPSAADVSAVLFSPPTISICRGVQQRNKATMKLGYRNPEEMYAAVKSRGGEAYKTKAGKQPADASDRAPAEPATPHAQNHGSFADAALQGGQPAASCSQGGRRPQPGAAQRQSAPAMPAAGTAADLAPKAVPLSHELHHGGGNRATQSRPMDAATAAIFGGKPSDAKGHQQAAARSTAASIAQFFQGPGACVPPGGYEAVPMRFPAAAPVPPAPLSAATNASSDKSSAVTTSTPFDGAFSAAVVSALPFDSTSLHLADRSQQGTGVDASTFFSTLSSVAGDKSNERQSQVAPGGASASRFAGGQATRYGSTAPSTCNPQQDKLAHAPPLFTGMPCGSDRELHRPYPDTLQGIARQVAAVGLGCDSTGAAQAGTHSSLHAPMTQAGDQPAAQRRQHPVESPFGGTQGPGMSWQLGSGTLGESFDPLMALQLLESRAADSTMWDSLGMNMDLFNSFAQSLDISQPGAAAADGPPAPSAAGASKPVASLERSRPTAPAAASECPASLPQGQPTGGAAASCLRDRERSLHTEMLNPDLQITKEESGGAHACASNADAFMRRPLAFPTPEHAEATDADVAALLPQLETSLDFGRLEATTNSSIPGPTTSREEGTAARSSTGAPSVNFMNDAEIEALEHAPVGARESAMFGTLSRANTLEDVYAAVPHVRLMFPFVLNMFHS